MQYWHWGVYITYKILDFPDLTVDGSFPLGAAVTAALIKRDESLSDTAGFLFGRSVAGVCTGLIHVKCKVRDLLSGIIMMTALWTVNLYIAGTANVPLFYRDIIFKNDFLIRNCAGEHEKLCDADYCTHPCGCM